MLTRRNLCLAMFAALFTAFVLAPTARAADDATGTWKWSIPGRNGGAARDVSLKLKQDGEKVTGTLNMGGNNAQDVEITDGKVKDGETVHVSVAPGKQSLAFNGTLAAAA